MIRLNANTWEIAAGAVLIVALTVVAVWLLLHKQPTAEEIERARRRFLVQFGRILDGMLLDVCEVEVPAKSKNEPGHVLTLLLYSYRIGGVDYECSQNITDMRDVVDASQIRVGFPCSARYQPGNPPNSIVVAEEWSGLRAGLPVLPAFEASGRCNQDQLDLLHPSRG
jgi:hypothetical protein